MAKNNRVRQISVLVFLVALASLLTGCWEPGQGTLSSTNNLSTTTNPGGAMAVQIVFSDNPNALTATGSLGAVPASFATPPATGTFPSAGLPAKVLYNADGSFLANGTSDTNWPGWLSSVELGITGSNSTYSLPGAAGSYQTNPNCARFATSSESSAPCKIGGTTTTCGAPNYQFRVSEADCNFAPTAGDPDQKGAGLGNGSSADNIYVRINLNRAGLGSTENLMMIVNYAASSYNPADPNPSDCFTSYNSVTGAGFTPGTSNNFASGSNLSPEACSDFAWKVYMRHSKSEGAVQPFATFIPPTYSYVANNPASTSGLTASTKQFIFPIAGDPGIQTIQLSRSFSKLQYVSGSGFQLACDPSAQVGGTGANTPNCAGLVLYSITLFRI